jgi:sodium-dependent dicarboxylate transporter 2/3/5
MTTTDRPVQRTDVDAAFRGSATYRSLGEQELSPAEERFEKGRRTVGLFLAPAVTIVFALLPLDLPRDQHLLAAVLLGVIVLWITEPVPIPVGGLIGVGMIVRWARRQWSPSSARSSWPPRCSSTAWPGGSP